MAGPGQEAVRVWASTSVHVRPPQCHAVRVARGALRVRPQVKEER